MREIVLDTETTGLDAREGHRIIEIGCIELVNHLPTDRIFHAYVNPERAIPTGAVEVHGLTADFLADKKRFGEIASAFLDFIEDAPLVIHNAPFDMGFLNAELERVGIEFLPAERAICTLVMARRKFPGSPNSLDALCRRFQINAEAREKHGALIDARLLAEVYLELIGGRQPHLLLDVAGAAASASLAAAKPLPQRPQGLPCLVTAEEAAAHRRFIDEALGSGALWREPSLLD